ncbi:MAG TPA: hypothetical protein VFA87_02275 [Rhizomicrobium sp.]|nr:hypothetical protein [Rhizomicrobium sp.]
MMAPFIYEEARANAPLHAQLFRYPLAEVPAGATSIRATGRVLRIFRNQTGSLHLGQKISFSIPIINRSGPPAPDGTIRHDPHRLAQARFWEVFLEYWEGEFGLVRSQLAPIRYPSWRPVCGPDIKGFLCEGNFTPPRSGKARW